MPEDHTAAVLFDWGDTLIRFPGLLSRREAHLACVDEAIAALVEEGGGALADLDRAAFLNAYAEVGVQLIARSERTGREHRMEERVKLALGRIGGQLSEQAIARVAHAIAVQTAAHADLMEGAADVLEALSGRVRLGLVSNYPSAFTVHETLRRFGIMQRFDVVVISETVGWLKPHRRPFEQAFAESGTRAAEVVFVGNDLHTDMHGAKAVGCRTAWLAPVDAAAESTSDVDIHLPRLVDLLPHIGA